MNVEGAYDLWSKQYDSNENVTRDLDKIVTIETLSQFEFNDVVELGCGTGKNTVYLLEKANHVIGLDFSENMLKYAKAKIADQRVDFRKVDIKQDWNLEDQFADLITSNLTLEHIEDLGVIFKQASQVLKSNGLFYISELHPFKQYLGSKARFDEGGNTKILEVYTHHISDYIDSAKTAGLKLLELKEWFDPQPLEDQPPRLITFVFQK